ncbi:uncharacterized protein METZ01_LOCUS247552, partial [marine metagenome]
WDYVDVILRFKGIVMPLFPCIFKLHTFLSVVRIYPKLKASVPSIYLRAFFL